MSVEKNIGYFLMRYKMYTSLHIKIHTHVHVIVWLADDIKNLCSYKMIFLYIAQRISVWPLFITTFKKVFCITTKKGSTYNGLTP